MTFEAAGSRAGGHGVTQPEAGPPADGRARADSGSAIPAAKGVTAENTWPGSSEPPGDNRQQLPARSRRKLTQGVMQLSAIMRCFFFWVCVHQCARCSRGIGAAGRRPTTSNGCPLCSKKKRSHKKQQGQRLCALRSKQLVLLEGRGQGIQGRKEGAGMAAIELCGVARGKSQQKITRNVGR